MKIHEPQIIQEGGQTVYRAGVDTAKGHETLWYGVDEAFGRGGDAGTSRGTGTRRGTGTSRGGGRSHQGGGPRPAG